MNEKNNTLTIISDDKETEEFGLQKVADCAYKELSQTDRLAIELSFVKEEEIRALNAEYRNVDKVTDVLSFPYLDGIRYKAVKEEDFAEDTDGENGVLIGSVCICLDRAKKQAAEYGHSLKREVSYLALHGMLHCFGYDHMTEEDDAEMTALADRIMKTLGVGRESV